MAINNTIRIKVRTIIIIKINNIMINNRINTKVMVKKEAITMTGNGMSQIMPTRTIRTKITIRIMINIIKVIKQIKTTITRGIIIKIIIRTTIKTRIITKTKMQIIIMKQIRTTMVMKTMSPPPRRIRKLLLRVFTLLMLITINMIKNNITTTTNNTIKIIRTQAKPKMFHITKVILSQRIPLIKSMKIGRHPKVMLLLEELLRLLPIMIMNMSSG